MHGLAGDTGTIALAKAQPRYMLLARRLVEDIARDRYPVGSLLPTEAMLSSQYNVSRFTVREAIRQLQDLGLVARRQGVGTRVVAKRPPAPRYTHSWSSVDELLQYAVDTRLHEIEMDDVVADAHLAETLCCPAGQRFLRIAGLRIAAKDRAAPPLCWTEIYVSAAFSGIRSQVRNHRGALANLIERRYGEKTIEIKQEIAALAIDPDLAARLDCETGQPGLKVQRWYIGADAKPFEITISVHPADRFNYSMRLRRNGAGE